MFLTRHPVSAQLAPRGHRPYVGRDPPIVGEQLLCFEGPRNGNARREKLRFGTGVGRWGKEIHAFEESGNVQVLRLGGMNDGLVIDGEVVHHVGVFVRSAVHARQAVSHDVANFVAVGGVVGDDGGVCCREDRRVAVGVLQSFARERRATSSGPNDKAARHGVARGPQGVTGALETEHGIEDINRDQDFTLNGVRSAHGSKRREGSRLIDAHVEDGSGGVFLVSQEEIAVNREVVLTVGVVNLRVGEEGVHAEGTGFVRNDRHEPVAKLLVADEVFEESHERHGRGNFLRARTLSRALVSIVIRQGGRREQ